MSELTAALATIEKCWEIVGCPAGADLQDHLRQLVAERDASLNAERVWEKTMMEVCGEDGPASVANEIRALRGLRDTALTALREQVEQLAAENVALKDINAWCKTDAFKNMYREFKTAESLGCSDVDCMHDAMLVAIMHAPETPATDRIVAGIKADGVEQAANECYGAGYICETLLAYAQQIREGDDK